MSEHVREYQRVSNAQATMTWSSGDRIDAQVATDFWEGTGERSIFSYNHTRREYTRVDVEERASVDDEPITAYRRVRTMEGWEPLDDLSTELTPCAPGDGGRTYSTWVVYNHTRREYVSGAPWPREASVDDKRTPFSRDLEELRGEVAQLYQEVEFWTKSASTWRERALEYWDADGEKQEEELVERVAKWAYSRSMDFLEDGPEWEALGSFVDMPTPRAEWLSQARAAIEGEK